MGSRGGSLSTGAHSITSLQVIGSSAVQTVTSYLAHPPVGATSGGDTVALAVTFVTEDLITSTMGALQHRGDGQRIRDSSLLDISTDICLARAQRVACYVG